MKQMNPCLIKLYYSSIMEENLILESEWIKIVDITQKEAFYLNTHGVPYHEDGISVTSSRHSGRSYRLCESKKNLEMLKRYRNGIIMK